MVLYLLIVHSEYIKCTAIYTKCLILYLFLLQLDTLKYHTVGTGMHLHFWAKYLLSGHDPRPKILYKAFLNLLNWTFCLGSHVIMCN